MIIRNYLAKVGICVIVSMGFAKLAGVKGGGYASE
jgi:hypothetical protein